MSAAISTTLPVPPTGERRAANAGVQPPPSRTFYEIEEQLQALLDTEEMVPEEQIGEYFADLAQAHADATRKRNGIIRALVSFDEQVEGAEAEIKRLKEHIARQEKAKERLQQYVIGVLKKLPEGRRKLTCPLGTLALRKGVPHVEILDTTKVPWNLQRAEIKAPGLTAVRILDALPEVAEFVVVTPDKKAIRAVLDQGGAVPGAALVTGEETLRLS